MDAETSFWNSTILGAPLDTDGLVEAPESDAVGECFKTAAVSSLLAKSGGWSWDDAIGTSVGSLGKRADGADVLAKRDTERAERRRERMEWARLESEEPISTL